MKIRSPEGSARLGRWWLGDERDGGEVSARNDEGFDLAFAPNGLAADAGPFGGAQVGKKFSQVALILSFADEAADGVSLSGAATAALDIDVVNVAAGHGDGVGAVAECAEIDGERAIAIELTQSADAIAHTSGEDGEFRAGGELVGALQFRRSDELDTEAGDGCGGGG